MLGKSSVPFHELEEKDGVLVITEGGLIDRQEELREFVEQRGWYVQVVMMLVHGITWDHDFEPQM